MSTPTAAPPETSAAFRPLDIPWWHRQRKALLLKRAYAAAFAKHGDPLVAKRLQQCSEFETLVACLDCGRSWWVTYRCGLRCCPICSWREAKKRQEYLAEITKRLPRPKHVVLTMPRWTGDAAEGITFIRACIAKLRRRGIFKQCQGGALTIEVLPKPDGWHIHAHLLVDAPYIPFQWLKKEWADLIGIADPHVSVQAAECDAARRYVAKYAGKSIVAEVGTSAIVRWYHAIQGKRLWGTFGKWFNFKLVEKPRDGEHGAWCPGCKFCGALKSVLPAECIPGAIGRGWRDWATGDLASYTWKKPIPEVVSFLNSEERDSVLTSPLEG